MPIQGIDGVRAMVEEHKPNLMVRSPINQCLISTLMLIKACVLVHGVDVDS